MSTDFHDRIYAAYSGIGLLPTRAHAVVSALAELHHKKGLGAFPAMLEASDRAVQHFTRLIGAEPGTVARTASTSQSLVSVAQITPWKAGDHIVLFRGEFPANTTPWQMAAERYDLVIDWHDAQTFTDAPAALERLSAALHPRTRMIAVSLVQFQTGLRMPIAKLAALAHNIGAEISVDGIQGLGAVPFRVDNTGVDWLSTGGQKWLCGPLGTGFLYGRPNAWRAARPTLASWLSHRDPLIFLDKPDALDYSRPIEHGPASLEGGTCNHLGFAGLGAALEALEASGGAEAVHAHTQAWHDAVEPALSDLGFTSLRARDPQARSGILSLIPPQGVTARDLVAALGERAVVASCPEGLLRVAPSLGTPLAACPAFVDRVAESLRSLR